MSGSQATEAAPVAGEDPEDGARPKLRPPGVRGRLAAVGRARATASWDERCAALFEDLRKPARVMIRRAFGSAFAPEEIEDVYANAWTSTLAALRGREDEMDDGELRSYLLTAVANHASKEMRRRRRKPTGALDDSHAQVVFDRVQPSPDEHASGSETGSQARDVLASLPPRRRAVMLLRYGWGLEPREVCRLIEGLSPRAYRKEITRGVEQMIARFRQLETGEWCASREPLLRDYVAGVADADASRQAREHISHCRSCNELVGKLSEGLHELGGGAAIWATVAGTLHLHTGSLAERLAAPFERLRRLVTSSGEAATQASSGGAATTGGRGVGGAGAGLLAKLGGAGAGGKLALACLGAGAIGGACVAGGVVEVPGTGDGVAHADVGRVPALRIGAGRAADALAGEAVIARGQAVTRRAVARADAARREQRRRVQARRRKERADSEAAGDSTATATAPAPTAPVDAATANAGAPTASPAPSASASQQEFGLPAAATANNSSGSSSPGPGSGGATGKDVAGEFGP